MRLEDKVAKAIGSWKFLIIQTVVLLLYVLLNTESFEIHHFDPFPFIFLNLVLSFQAAYTAPILLISHNRMAERDRELAEQDRKNTKIILDTIRKLEKNLIDKIEEIEDENEDNISDR